MTLPDTKIGEGAVGESFLAPAPPRRRSVYALAVAIVIIAGLGSRRIAPFLPVLLRKYPGDVLWATLAFLLCGLLFPRLSGMKTAWLAAAISLAVECAKLYHAPWLDAIRPTVWGRLLFGTSFSFANLVCYSAGILLGWLIERGLLHKVDPYFVTG